MDVEEAPPPVQTFGLFIRKKEKYKKNARVPTHTHIFKVQSVMGFKILVSDTSHWNKEPNIKEKGHISNSLERQGTVFYRRVGIWTTRGYPLAPEK